MDGKEVGGHKLTHLEAGGQVFFEVLELGHLPFMDRDSTFLIDTHGVGEHSEGFVFGGLLFKFSVGT